MNVAMVLPGETDMELIQMAQCGTARLCAVIDDFGMCVGLQTFGEKDKHSMVADEKVANGFPKKIKEIDGKGGASFLPLPSSQLFEWSPTPPNNADENWSPDNRPWKTINFTAYHLD